MKRYKRILIYMFLISMLSLLVGCRTKESFSEVTPSVTPAIDKQIKQVDSGPVQGGTLTLPVTAVDSLNPYLTRDKYVNHISFFIYESLFIQTEEGHVEPWLVTDWENKEDTIWNFTIQEDVLFQHGVTLTAYDVKYTMGILETSDSPFYDTELFKNIQEINIVNSNQLEVQLKTPDPAFAWKLTFPILSQTAEDKSTGFVSGTGPFQYDYMDKTALSLKRFEKWWQDTPPYIDSVVFKVYLENEMLDAFQNNEVDVAFVRNVDFSKYQHRTDIGYQVYPESKGNFITVNPNSLFGQATRRSALFRYITFRLQDMNLGQVQYFDEYNESPIDAEGLKAAMIATGLYWNEMNRTFTQQGKALETVSIVVPKQDIQKLHTANFLINILADAGIKAAIQTVSAQDMKKTIRNGNYDLSPVTEELKSWETLDETLQRLLQDYGNAMDSSYVLPLYRNQQAILFKNHIRGEKNAIYWNPYQGFSSWYKPVVLESNLEE